jgi:hypothetical protein
VQQLRKGTRVFRELALGVCVRVLPKRGQNVGQLQRVPERVAFQQRRLFVLDVYGGVVVPGAGWRRAGENLHVGTGRVHDGNIPTQFGGVRRWGDMFGLPNGTHVRGACNFALRERTLPIVQLLEQ